MNIHSIFDYKKSRNWIEEFYKFDTAEFEKIKVSEEVAVGRAWSIFRDAAERVPAYKDFLKKHGVDHKKVRDFSEIPVTAKKNYIQTYPLEQRCWNGNLDGQSLIAVSSGTSGEATYWPRGGYQEFEQAVTHEFLYRKYFEIHKHKTLIIIGFPMGVYVSGIATLLPSWLVAQKYPNVTIVSVGND